MIGNGWEDPRWRRLKAAPWSCPCCGEEHQGLPDLGVDRPIYCAAELEISDPDQVGDKETYLTSDVCVLEGKHFFARGVLELPILGALGESFRLGLWSSLSHDSFLDLAGASDCSGVGPWFGWISNELPGYPKMTRLACHVTPRAGGLRPSLLLKPEDHPLSIEQREGISLDRILELFADCGHDIGAAVER